MTEKGLVLKVLRFLCASVLSSGDNDFFIVHFSKMSEPIFQMSVSVESSSIDLLGHVNNREYIRWMEEAATKHAASCGWTFETLRSAGLAWVVRQHWVEYLKPALLGDDLNVCTWVQNMRRVSSLRRYAIMRGTDLLMVGATEWVLVDYQKRRPIVIPQDVQSSFPLTMPEAQELQQLGIRRMVRFVPSPGLV